VEETLADADIPVLATYIHDRQLYRRVVSRGGSVVSEHGPARDEMLRLAGEILHVLETAE